MIEIKDLLARFDRLLLKEEFKKESIKRALAETIGVKIENSDIEIKNNTVYLNLKPIYKNEILIKREKIEARLEKIITIL